MALPALRHRIMPSPELELEGRDTDAILKGLLEKIEAPRLDVIVPSTRLLWAALVLAALAIGVSIFPDVPAAVGGDRRGLRAARAARPLRRAAAAGARARAPRAGLARARRALRGHAARGERRRRWPCAWTCTTTTRRASRPKACRARLEPRARRMERDRLPGAAGGARRGAVRGGRGAPLFAARAVADQPPGWAAERRCASIPTSARWRSTRCSPPTTACRRSACCRCAGAARAWSSTSCASTARATRSAPSTGRRPRAPQRLIAREYEEEKDQRVLLVIDCGRRMASKDDDALALRPRAERGAAARAMSRCARATRSA